MTPQKFYKYMVRQNKATKKYSIYYVWSDSEKELIKANLTPYEVLSSLRDYYLDRNGEYYAKAKAYFLPLIEKEF